MSLAIAAIPTRYAGCHFRSRLEARWAVFFDALGIRWEFEPEGFTGCLGEGYLPDFWLDLGADEHLSGALRERGLYAEVKPTQRALHADGQKIGACIDYDATPLSRTGLLILGPVPEPATAAPLFSMLYWRKGVNHRRVAFYRGAASPPGPDGGDRWTLTTLQFDSRVADCGFEGIPPAASPVAELFCVPLAGAGELDRALTAARSARFEHGQSGPT